LDHNDKMQRLLKVAEARLVSAQNVLCSCRSEKEKLISLSNLAADAPAFEWKAGFSGRRRFSDAIDRKIEMYGAQEAAALQKLRKEFAKFEFIKTHFVTIDKKTKIFYTDL